MTTSWYNVTMETTTDIFALIRQLTREGEERFQTAPSTPKQITAIRLTMMDIGCENDNARYLLLARIFRRDILSTKDLTKAEASALISVFRNQTTMQHLLEQLETRYEPI